MISRRQFLRTIAAASAASTGGRAAFSQTPATKFKPAEVAYQTTPKGDQRCSNCSLFTTPNICAILTARVVSSGWCTAWAMKPA